MSYVYTTFLQHALVIHECCIKIYAWILRHSVFIGKETFKWYTWVFIRIVRNAN